MKTSRCTGPDCGRQIVWGVTADGKKIPLDASAPTYRISGIDRDGTTTIERSPNSLVSHFTCCANADRFHGGRR